MLKIGVIGLGDIAQKAYLPVLSKKEPEVHLFTRDQANLSFDSQALHRILHGSFNGLITNGNDRQHQAQ